MPSGNLQLVKRFSGAAILVIPLFLTGLACQPSENRADRPRTGTKNIAATLGVCSTKDTLLELIGQGISAAKQWELSDSIEGLEGLMRAIENTGLKPNTGSGLFDTFALAGLVKTVYRDWGITFNPCEASVGAFFPQMVYGSKKGACLGIALLFLLVAEKYGYPLHGVVLPGHFFLRIDEGRDGFQRNIEPNAMGTARSDDYYRQRYGISAGSWYYPLRTLSKKETAGVFFYMVGNICREKGKLPEAGLCYKTALRLFPDYPDAIGNMALLFSSLGKKDSALYFLDRAAGLNPLDSRIWRNKGSLLLETGRYKAAVDLAVERLAITPDDTVLLYIAALGAAKTGRQGDAMKALDRFRPFGDSGRTQELERMVSRLKR